MSDIDDRLASIERRLQQLELTGVRPIDPLAPPQPIQPFGPQSTLRNLVFWISLIILGVVIWEFSNKLSN